MTTATDEIEVVSWRHLDGVVAAMDDVAGDLADTTSYAVAWMCRPDGFAPSPLCLLRPLAEVMDVVADALAEAGRRYLADWQRLRDGVAVSAAELRASDDRAHARAVALLDALAA